MAIILLVYILSSSIEQRIVMKTIQRVAVTAVVLLFALSAFAGTAAATHEKTHILPEPNTGFPGDMFDEKFPGDTFIPGDTFDKKGAVDMFDGKQGAVDMFNEKSAVGGTITK